MSGHVRRTPHQAREAVHARQGGLCLSCHTGLDLAHMHLHHRRRRRELEPDALWCTCVLAGLHPLCHAGVHNRPEWSRERGLIVPTWATELVPVLGPWGWEEHDHDGSWRRVDTPGHTA